MTWELVSLGDVLDVRDGTHDSPKYVTEGYPLVTSKNITNGKLDLSTVSYISQNDYNKINSRSKVEKGDIIMPMIGTIGGPLLVNEDPIFAIKNVALFKFNNQTKIFNKFIYFLLKSPIFNNFSEQKSRGGTQKFVSLGNLRKLQIPLPPLPEQQRIAALLEKVDHLRSLRRQSLKRLDDLVQATFLEMFGDPVTNPMGWDTKLLEDIISPDNSISYGIVQPGDDYPNGIPIVRPVDIDNNFVDISNLKRTSPNIEIKFKKTRLTGHELLISVRGTTGITYVTNSKFRGFNVTRGLAVIRPATTNLVFLNSFMQTKHAQSYIARKTRGATLQQINLSELRLLEVQLPPLHLQQAFAERVQHMDTLKQQMQASMKKLEQTFNTLMHQAFNGEVNWKDAEQAVAAGQLELPLGV